MYIGNNVKIASMAVALGLCITTGCQTSPNRYSEAQTPAAQMEARADALRERAALVKKGQQQVADGEALVARGRTMTEQGNRMEGQRLVIEGEAKIREGNLYLDQANAIRLPDAPNTVASGSETDVRVDGDLNVDRVPPREPTAGSDYSEIDRNAPRRDD